VEVLNFQAYPFSLSVCEARFKSSGVSSISHGFFSQFYIIMNSRYLFSRYLMQGHGVPCPYVTVTMNYLNRLRVC
jgi:hypothetical protein